MPLSSANPAPVRERAASSVDTDGERPLDAARDTSDICDACDYCGSRRLEWRKCKLICASCRQINKSCADL